MKSKNKIIAEFMGWTQSEKRFKLIQGITGNSNHLFSLPKIHEDWNLLMAVVERIESIKIDNDPITVMFNANSCTIQSLKFDPTDTHKLQYWSEEVLETKIQSVHEACYKFIEWYSQL